MIETVIQEHTDALNRNTAAVLALAAALSTQPAAPAKRSRAKAEPTMVTMTRDPEPTGAPEPEPAGTPEPEPAPQVEPESEPQPEPAGTPEPEPEPVVVDNRDVTHEQVMNIVREFRQGLDTANYAKNKADLAEVLKRFGAEAISKAPKEVLPELLIAVKEICR